MILNDSINVLVIIGCSVWCKFFGSMVFGFFLGRMVMYLCISHSIYVSKFWGGGWRLLVACVWLLWED